MNTTSLMATGTTDATVHAVIDAHILLSVLDDPDVTLSAPRG